MLRAPYRAGEHPSASELLHALLSIAPNYGDRLIRGQTPLPAHHAERLARDLEVHYASVSELIADLKRHATHRQAEIGKHVPRRRSTKGLTGGRT